MASTNTLVLAIRLSILCFDSESQGGQVLPQHINSTFSTKRQIGNNISFDYNLVAAALNVP